MMFKPAVNMELANLVADNLHDFDLNKRSFPFIMVKYRELFANVANGAYLKPLLNINTREEAIKYGYSMYLILCGLSVKGMKTIGSPMTKSKPVVVGQAVLEQVIELHKQKELQS